MKNDGPLFGGSSNLSFAKGSNPPSLADYSNEAKYDLATVVQIVRVRPMILWGWEQQLGIPAPMRVHDDSSSNGRRYSERDIVAALWLREQILNGVLPNEAAARLLGSRGTRRVNTGSLAGSGSGALSAPLDDPQRSRMNASLNITPMNDNDFDVQLQRNTKATRRLSEQEQSQVLDTMASLPNAEAWTSGPLHEPRLGATSGPLDGQRGAHSGQLGSSYAGTPGTSSFLPDLNGPNVPNMPTMPTMPTMSPTSRPLPGSGALNPADATAYGTGSLGRTSTMGQQTEQYYSEQGMGGFPSQSQQRPGMTSGPLGNNYNYQSPMGPYGQNPEQQMPPTRQSGAQSITYQSGAQPITRQPGPQFIPATPESSVPGVPWTGPGAPLTHGRELRLLLPQFIRAFTTLDTISANYIVNEALASRSVETICIGLLLPALNRVSNLTGRHEISVPEERFALNYVRSFLFSIFHRTPERSDASRVFVSCGAKEMNDVNALTLAVFWRRAGLRVVYFGQDIEKDSLVQEVREHRPALVAVVVTTTPRIRSLARLAKSLNQLDAPKPYVTFAGPVFVRNPELQHKVNGVYLGDDAATATWHVTNLLGINRGAAVTTYSSGPQTTMN